MSTPFGPSSMLPLLCLVRVVEEGSFAEAGRRLGMTTSGVSKAISRFETEHGIRLLHRSTHSLSLTKEGEQLVDEARDVVRAYERLRVALSQAADGGRAGRVRISAPPGFTRACLLPILPRLLDAHPEIEVEVHGSYELIDLADQGIDIALRAGPVGGLPGHVCQTLLSSPWCAYAAPAYLLRRGTPESPGDLAGHELIGFRNRATGRVGAWQFRHPEGDCELGGRVHHEPFARAIFDDGSAAFDMALGGHGIVWAPEWLAFDDLCHGRVIEVLRAWRSSESVMSLVRRERRLTPFRVRVVAEFLRDAAQFWRTRAVPVLSSHPADR